MWLQVFKIPLQVQVLEAEEEPDDTISMTDHTGDPPGAVEDDDEPGPLVTEVNNTFCNALLKNTIFN